MRTQYKEDTDIIGQVVTYTCKKGYEYDGDPVASATPAPTTTTTVAPTTTTNGLTWHEFREAQYSMIRDSSITSWQSARDACQSIGGDLASIPSFAVQKFIMDTFQNLDQDKWIGGKQTNGVFQWVNGDTFEYKYNECGFQIDNKLCLIMVKDKNGKWNSEDCSRNDIKSAICQKGRSTSTFWYPINGAEFAHLENDCIQSLQDAVDSCVDYGGNMASILSQSTLDQLETTFSPQTTKAIWIGLNSINDGDTFEWKNGDPYIFTAWQSGGNDNNDDRNCVAIKNGFKFDNVSCSDSSINGYLCMKGSLALPQYVYEWKIGPGKSWNDEYTQLTLFDLVNEAYDGDSCCYQCGLWHQTTNYVSFNVRQCRCQVFTTSGNNNPGKRDSRGFNAGECNAPTGRKKRYIGADVSKVQRSKREVLNFAKSREIECALTGTAGYWKYDYTIPNKCYSKSRVP